jgi:hypothetical protein
LLTKKKRNWARCEKQKYGKSN